MITRSISRRFFVQGSAAMALAGAATSTSTSPAASAAEPLADASTSSSSAAPFRFCLNTSTIREQNLTLPEVVELVSAAGYDGIEPWLREIQVYRDAGGSLPDLRRRIEDAGLRVESAIGFARWIVDDPAERAAGLESLKRDMDLVHQLGGTRIAAPPVGATDRDDLDLRTVAQRYRAALEVGAELGVTPQLELWGFSKTLSRLGELMMVATEAAHPQACLLPDVYHIYKGGSDFTGLNMIAGRAIHVFHLNDYPAEPPRETIRDSDRVYPGDGIAPLPQILKQLSQNGFRGVLSLELFNPDYYRQDPAQVVRTGLAKMRQVVERGMG